MEIIDSQVHIWQADRPDRPWVPGAKAHLPDPIGYESLLGMMEEAGVSRAVLVPPAWEGERIDYCLEAAATYPNKFAVMGRIPIEKPEARHLIETLKDWKEILGIRLTFHREEDRAWFNDGTVDWFWPSAERLQIPVMVNAPTWVREIGRIAGRFPGLTLILDHMGLRGVKDDAIAAGIENALSLAQFPNVHIKMTLVPSFSSAPYPYRNIHPYLRRLVDAFGPKRCFWGTDLSAMKNRSDCTYREAVELFTHEMDFLSNEDKEWIMGRGIAECLRWSIQDERSTG